MSDAMTEEEYLSARGWKQSIGAWSREYGDRADWMPTAEAVAVQLEEDRRLYNFVRARSEMNSAMLSEPKGNHNHLRTPQFVMTDTLARLTAAERVDAIASIAERWCLACGAEQPRGQRCQCDNDE